MKPHERVSDRTITGNEALLSSRFQVDVASIKILAASTAAASLGCAAWTWSTDAMYLTFTLLLFAAAGSYLILIVGPIEMDGELIATYTPLGNYAMRWDEVERVETDHTGATLAFMGGNKRLVMVGPSLWSGEDRQAMMACLTDQIEERGIETTVTLRAAFIGPRNTKL